MRGGMGYSAQGTGITSGMDTPRPRYYGGGAIEGDRDWETLVFLKFYYTYY